MLKFLRRLFKKVFGPKEKVLMEDKMTVVLNRGGKKCEKH